MTDQQQTEKPSVWRDGDVFFWQWTDDARKSFTFGDPDWCVAHKAVVKNGFLVDLYWSSESKSWKRDDIINRMVLTYRGNIHEMEPIHHYELRYYEDADVVDLTHSNHTKATCYRRKGAQRSLNKALDILAQKRSDAESDLRMAVSRLQDYARTEALIRGGHMPLDHMGY